MNKQEAIKTIEQDKIQVGRFTEITREVNAIRRKIEMVDYVPLETVVSIIDKINEQQKPVVPKLVAEWLDILDEHGLFGLNYDIVDESVQNWVYENYDCNAKKLHLAYLYGYEIEQEKLYTVEIPNPNLNAHTVLQKTEKGIVLVTVGNAMWKGCESSKLTESEIKKDFDFLWQFAKVE